MRQIREMFANHSLFTRSVLTAVIALSVLLTTATGAGPGNFSFFGAHSLFKPAPRDNIFLPAAAGFEPYSLAMPTYSTLGSPITENFDGMGNSATASLPTDWRFGSATAYSSGVTAATAAAGTSGTGILSGTSGGAYYNFANGVTASATDRAPGWLTSSTFTSPRQLFVRLTNNTGSTIGSADIAYDIEKYRSGSRAFTINFFTSTDGSTWTAQTAGDQAYSANANNTTIFNPPTTTSKSFTVNGLSIPNGSDLYLRWSYTGTFGGGSSSTNAQGLGIDNFSFTPYQATPGTLQFTAATSNANENALSANMAVSRTGGSFGAVSADYAVTGGSASGGAACTAGVDYVLPSGTLNWADGDASNKSIPVQLCTDLLTAEGPETIAIGLSNAQGGATLGGTTTHTFTINDSGASFFNTNPITINGGPASPYPSDITVSGLTGTINELKVTLQGVSHSFPDDIDVLLVGPGGQTLMLMSDVGGDPDISNRVYTFADSGASTMSNASNNASGTYKPTNHDTSQQDDNFDAPAPAPPYNSPGPAGTSTFASVFNDTDPNGTWHLYVRDAFAAGDNGSISGGWNVEFKLTAPGPGTVQFSPATVSGGEGTTATVTARRVGGSLGAASVDYTTSNGTASGGAACGAGVDFVNTSGTLSWADGEAGTKTFNVQLCSDTELAESTETAALTLSNPTGAAISGTNPGTLNILNSSIGGSLFTNYSSITIPQGGNASPYPSTITISGVGNSILDMRLSLNGFSHTYTSDVVMMLVGPGGQQYLFFAGVGSSNPASGVNLQLYDGAPGTLSGDPIVSGAYPPSNLGIGSFPLPPAPQGPYFQAAPVGTDTFLSTFGSTDPNGVWSLYVYDQATPDSGSLSGGWDLQVTTGAAPVGTIEFNPATYNTTEGGVTTIIASRVGGTSGAVSVDFATSNGTATGGAACGAGVDFVNNSGTLSWAPSEGGTKSFTVTSCTDSVTPEAPETVTLTFSNPTGTTITGTNPATLTINNDSFGGSSFSNTAPITIPDSGAASPYPSTITVSGMSGNLSNIRVRLNNVSHSFGADTMMLLVAPTGDTFTPFSNVGGNVPINNVSVILDDAAGGLIPSDVFTSDTYKPTNYGGDGSYPSPAPGAPYNEAAPAGSSTLLSSFGGINPNGDWKLYVFDQAGGDQGSVAGGWQLDIETTAPTPGTVEFSAATYNGLEGATSTITARRVGGSLGAISVDYATSDGTATGGAACGAGVDFVNASGTLSWVDGETANKTFTVQSCSDAEIAESTETVSLALSNPVNTSITGTNPATMNIENNAFAGSTFSNPTGIVIPAQGTSTPYPSTIEVSGMTGAITEVRVLLKNFNHTYASDVDVLLVGPGGQKFVVMSDVGSNTTASGVTLSLYDSAAANLTGAPLTSGSYKPTDIPGNTDVWPAPAPTGPYNSPAPWGGSTFANVFNGANPNGTWSLYVYDRFSPDGGSFADGWELQIAAAETVRFSPDNYTPYENGGTVSVTVVRPSSHYAATVDYTLPSAGSLYPAVGDTTCAPGVDYINTPGTLNFGIGDLSKNIDITLCDDAVFDGLKIILPELSNPTGGMILGSPSVATVFINDDETPPTISISDVTVNESAGTASFLVTQSFPTSTLTQFLYSTSDGTALNGFDYTGVTNATGTITAGNTTTNIVVPILGDSGFEETETFTVNITNGAINANVVDGQGVGTITDDDPAASYVVTTTNNANDGTCDGTHCSLREAIIASNSVPGVITFAPGVTGTITFTGSRPSITNNTVINGPGADVLAVSGGNSVTVFDIVGSSTAVTIRGLTVRNGNNGDFGSGGGFTNAGLLTVENSVITQNTGNFAGAIQTYGPLTIRSSTLSNNAGGLNANPPACSSFGGAIDSSNDNTIYIDNSTISGNTVLQNCFPNSGAINLFSGRVVINGSTITNNASSSSSSAIGGGTASTSIISNSIIAGNTGNSTAPDLEGLYQSGGFNLIGNPGAVTVFTQLGDQVGSTGTPLDPMLGALGNNGGTTPTHAPLAGSPVLDKGRSYGLTTDQRGRPRPVDNPDITNAPAGDGSDIGAYEAAVSGLIVTGGPLNFGSVPVGQNSTEQTYTVSGSDLTANVTVTAPAEFQVSTTSGSGFGSSVTLTPSGGTLSATTIYVRFAPTSGGLKTGDVTNESTGATTRNVAVSGTGNTPGSLQFTTATLSDGETNADHTFNVTVSRTGGDLGAVDVDYSVSDGTATTADNDYSIVVANGNLSWAAGDSTDKQIEITIKGDTKFETDETISISLTDAHGGAVIGSPSSATLTITNDDAQPTVSVDDVTFTGVDSLVGSGFTVSLSNPSYQTTTVHYQTADDSAIAGQDYTTASGTLTFNPGETTKNVPIAILPNAVNEATEQFFINLDTPTNATIADGQGVGTINDDDPPATLAINDVTHTEGNSGTTTYTFTVTKTGVTDQTVTVDYATANGTAASPSDFTAASGTLTFAPAETSKDITVTVNGDTDYEVPEIFYVRLSNNAGGDIADGQGSGFILNDDDPTIYIVNVNDDTDDGACNVSHCSLREAINAANSTGGQITFAANVTGSISLLTPLPALVNPNAIQIIGPGASVLTVKRDAGASAMRIFDINGAGNYTINGLAINDGDVRPIGGAFNNLGGGIRILQSRGVTINSCTFTNNWANNGAAIYNGTNTGTGPLTVNYSTFTANNANQSGGGIENRFSNLLTVNYSTFDANGAPFFGGGIHNLASGVVFVSDSTFTGNVANTGGAINNDDTGSLTIRRSNISGNQAVVGGGISNKNGGLDVFDSTISGNNASEGAGAYNYIATMNFYNSTISGNTATSIGGGIYYTLQGQSNGTIQNCTISGNHGPNGGGVMVFNGSSVVRMGNTILAANTGSQGPDLYGTIYSNGYNILGTTGGSYGNLVASTGDQVGQFSIINPMLGALADNGGPTKTRLPLAGSPAINAGNSFGETADQRGFTRTVGGATDIGAVEIQAEPTQIVVFAGSPQSTVEGTAFAPLQARVLDASNAPVGGVTVTFTAPGSGPSGTFANSTTQTTAITDANGVATSSVLTANNSIGSFNVVAGYAASPLANFALTITETPRQISVNDVTFTGADSLVGSGFTVSLNTISSQTITVHYQTADGTAVAGEDYTAASGTLTFNPGETAKEVPITILPDTVNEPTEQFVINLDTPVNAVILDGQGIGTIPNDDAEVSFSIDDVTHNEGSSGTTSYTFTVTKNGATSQATSVNWETAPGTATSPDDFTAVSSTTLNFLPSDASKQVTVQVNGDIFVETDEAFTVHLSSPVNATISDADGTGTITNDDNPPNVTYVDDNWTALSIGTDPDAGGPAIAIGYDAFDTVQEGIDAVAATGTVNVYAGLYRENPNVNKAVSLVGPNAGVAGDAVRGAEATIGASGNTQNVVTINSNNITIDGFTVDGDDPGVTGVPIYTGDDTNASYALRSGSFNHLQVKNNIVKRVSIGFRAEGDSKDNTISGNWFDSIGSFDFGYAVTLRNNYYADVTNNKMTRVWTGVHVNNFSFAGGPALMTVSGNNVKAYAAGLFSTLRYNAASPLIVSNNRFEAEAGAVDDNAGILLTSTQNAVSTTFTGNTIVNTHYGIILTTVSTSNVIDFGATNSVTGAVKAGVYVTDNLTFNPVSTTLLTSPTTAPMSAKLSGISVAGPGATGVKVENTRSANPIANNVEITGASIGFFSKGLEVTGPLTNVTMTGSTIAASATGIAVTNSGGTPVSLTAHYNRIVADTFAITNTDNQPLALENNWWGCNAGPGNTGCGSVTGSGADFDPWTVLGISASPNPIGPGTSSTVTADMTHNSDGLVPSVTDFIPQVGASFAATEGSVAPPTGTITSGTAATTFTSNSMNPATASTTVDHQTVSTNIGITLPSFSIDNVTMNEGNSGTTSFTFTVTKSGATGFTSSVNYATQNGTAAAGTDYAGITSTTLTFGPAETSKEVTVLVNGDGTYENNETFTVELSGEANATIADGSGLGTITNDDAQPSFSINDITMNEGDSGFTNFSFTVTKTGETEVTSEVQWFNANGTATSQEGDYVPATGTLEFAPGVTSVPLTVQVVGETVYENDENFTVELNSAVGATISDAQGTATITNDDAAPTIAIDDVTMSEGDSGTKTFTFTITRTGLTAFNGGVDYVVQEGTATSADDDLVVTSGNVGFPRTDTSETVSVTVKGDTKYEGDETFTVHLQNEAGFSVTKRDGLGTITNDDTAPTFSISDHTFTGADSGVVTGFTVTLTGPTALPATVHYQTADGTAIAGEDYTATSGTLTFNPGGPTTQTIPVNILPDTTQEATEQFVVNLDTPVGATITDGQGVGTIPNDDAAPTFSIDNVTQAEGSGGFTTFVFFVTKTGPTALPSSIDYTTQPGTATAGALCSAGSGVDYETRSGTLNFAAGDTTQMVLVNVCGDTIVEGDETFTIQLSNAVNGTITDGEGLGTIQNNTTPAVHFASATYLEDESQTAVITLMRSGDTSGTSTVTFSTSNGTAAGGSCGTPGIDYQSVSTPVTFDPTETTKSVNVPVCMDTLFESTFETVNLTLTSGSTVIGEQGTAVLNLNDTAAQYKSTAPIIIGDGGNANPYPTSITVSGAPSVTGTMRITLFDLTHTNPEDIEILLVAPNGTSMVLMADAGGANPLTGNGATITFDDTAGAVLPNSTLIATGKYEPTTWGPVSPFTPPAPGGPYAMPNSTVGGSINLNSVFGAGPPNGTWQLFIRDGSGIPPLGAGQIAAGWGLQFLAPTEGTTSVSGRVTTAAGNGIRNAIVKISGGNLSEPRIVATGSLGVYQFDGLAAGQTYVIQVSAKRFRFAEPARVFTLMDATTNLDFVANPQE